MVPVDCIDMLIQLHYFFEKMIEWNDVFDLMMVLVVFVEHMGLLVAAVVFGEDAYMVFH
jgi:hypothetical protein